MIGKKAGTGSTVMMIGFSLLLVVVIIGVLVPMIKNAGDSQLMQLDELQGQATDASPEFKYHDKLPTEIRTKFELLVKSFYVTDDSYGLVKIPFIAEDDKFFGKEEPNIGKYTLYIIPAPSGGGIVFLLMVEDKKSTQMADGQRAALAIAPGKELCVVGHEAKSFKPIREYTNIVKNSWRDIYPTTLSASEEMWPETEKVSQIIWEENGNRNKIKAEFKKGEKEQDFVYIPKPKDGNGQTNLFLWNHENKRCFVLKENSMTRDRTCWTWKKNSKTKEA
ncbi:MAG: hypothetical protein KKG59_01730 [Nanoarchaeota archaeon]|nr:hypothetical protein [Nanoarchaeota archaeon]